ncbi:MAG TPA: hypothetical protein PKY59_06230 [Pyrinomonadaceae bacterium]|nr:hypothetical protein [Pyrinomonadaceae bacterium]
MRRTQISKTMQMPRNLSRFSHVVKKGDWMLPLLCSLCVSVT